MSKPNRLMKLVNATEKLPNNVRTFLLSKAFGQFVPLVGTAGLHYDYVSQHKVIVSIKNHRAVQNHIKGVHAAAMALLVETATGFVTVLNVPDHRILLIKSLHVDYLKVAQGNLTATATLSDEHIKFITETEKGELEIPVTVIDDAGQSPIQCKMLWAWLPKKRK